MKKILITGANGFVGKALDKYLRTFNTFESIELIRHSKIDLTDVTAVHELPKADVIVHLASKNFIPESFTNPALYYNNNISSTINCLEKARVDGAAFIFFSTYVYGPPKYLPIDEKHPTHPLNPYTQSKLSCEQLCEAFHRDFNVPVTIFRPFNIYGPGQNPVFFIPTILRQIHESVIQLNDSRPKRDFIFISDIIEAIYLAINQEKTGMHVFNLGTGLSTSVRDVVNTLHMLTASTAEIRFSDKSRQGEILDTVADISKIKSELNWVPKISLAEGLQKVIEAGSKPS